MDPASRACGEDRTAILHDERLVTLESWVFVGDHPDPPGTVLVIGRQRRRGLLLVAWAERARLERFVGESFGMEHEGVGSRCASGGDDDPSS